MVALVCYVAFALLTIFPGYIGLIPTIIFLSFCIALHSSLQHEALHGHPFSSKQLNELLVFLPIGLLIPYRRFRDTHLVHHNDPTLTDPYDDPESNYIDPAIWKNWPSHRQRLYVFNNCLIGRILIGPAVSLCAFFQKDIGDLVAGNRRILKDYLLHFVGIVPLIFWWYAVANLEFWAYIISAYMGLSILKIRTYLEHTAHEHARCRSVIIEDRGLLSLIFLKNNLHSVHHAHPSIPWYRLQSFYESRRESFLRRNEGYVYSSYWAVIFRYLFRIKDPVEHPLREKDASEQQDNIDENPLNIKSNVAEVQLSKTRFQ